MLIGIFGTMGKGKTLTLTWLAYLQYLRKRKIISNYPLTFPHDMITKPNELEELRDSFISLDEVHLWLNSKDFMKNKNRLITQIILNSRRRNNTYAYTSQREKLVDKTIRDVTDVIMYPELDENTGICTVKTVNFTARKTNEVQTKIKFDARPIYNLYDTYQELGYLQEDKNEID